MREGGSDLSKTAGEAVRGAVRERAQVGQVARAAARAKRERLLTEEPTQAEGTAMLALPRPRSSLGVRARYALIAFPVVLLLAGNTILRFVGTAPERGLAPDFASAACATCTYTLGDKAATSAVSPSAAAALVLAPSDLPEGFTVTQDEILTIEGIAKDDETARQLRDAGHLAGWWRVFGLVSDSGGIDVISGANIYASSKGATDMFGSDLPSTFVPFPRGKFRKVIPGLVLGDYSYAYVFESPETPDITAYTFFRTGAINEWIYVVAAPTDFKPELFVRLAYAQLAHSYNGRR